MAGTILISDDQGLAISTVEFDYLVECIRGSFLPEDQSVAELVYEPLDEGGMTFISAVELDEHSYPIFAETVRRACATSRGAASFSRFEARWKEFLEIIEQDPRCKEKE
ncbi:MAG: hypothetical protein KKD25_00135 [Gammaproteobacteria bacterium]|jgi:hypothetical protein|nr:hypothetical protein [Gammaproteobacteria bacterium]MBU0855788.1 hypothetical protein [Gammaproteobacteria bacterium]MBU1846943.1 hypothetical protein [Gammaproteobacteria bacterium]